MPPALLLASPLSRDAPSSGGSSRRFYPDVIVFRLTRTSVRHLLRAVRGRDRVHSTDLVQTVEEKIPWRLYRVGAECDVPAFIDRARTGELVVASRTTRDFPPAATPRPRGHLVRTAGKEGVAWALVLQSAGSDLRFGTRWWPLDAEPDGLHAVYRRLILYDQPPEVRPAAFRALACTLPRTAVRVLEESAAAHRRGRPLLPTLEPSDLVELLTHESPDVREGALHHGAVHLGPVG